MRFYNLTITSPAQTLVLNESSPFGLDLNFSIQAGMSATQVIPTTVEIINAGIEFFTLKGKNLQNSIIILSAGIKKSPFIVNQNISTNFFNQPLIIGKIGASFSQWELTDTRLTLQVNSAPLLVDNITFTLNTGEPIAIKVATYLTQRLSRFGFIFNVDPFALGITFQNRASTTFNMAKAKNTIVDVINRVSSFIEPFGLGIASDGVKKTIYNLQKPLVTTNVVVVHPTTLVSQPTYMDAASCQLEIMLNPNITLGSIISLTNNLNLFSGSILGDAAGVILRNAMDARLLRAGLYKVVEVIHKGESRNPDPKAWCTTVKCIPIGEV